MQSIFTEGRRGRTRVSRYQGLDHTEQEQSQRQSMRSEARFQGDQEQEYKAGEAEWYKV